MPKPTRAGGVPALVGIALILLACSAQAGVSKWVPLELHAGQLLFPVEIDGHAGRAMLDTGAQGNSVSQTFVEKAGLKLWGRKYRIEGVVSSAEFVSSVSSLPVSLFGIRFDLADVPAMPHDEYELTIGAGFLKAAVLQLDYPNLRMRLITHDAIDLSKAANLPLRLEQGSGLPAVEVEIDGTKRWMLLDTGNAGPIVMRRLIAQEGDWIARFKRAEGSAIDVNAATANLDILVLPSVKLGPFELEDVPIAIPAKGEPIRISGARSARAEQDTRIKRGVRVSGIVGYEVLRHFVVTVDYDRQKAHVALPAEEPAEAARGSASE